MKKAEAEKAIRDLCEVWGDLVGIPRSPESMPSFSEFLSWIGRNHPAYRNFRSTTSAQDDAERWFDQKFKQGWRN